MSIQISRWLSKNIYRDHLLSRIVKNKKLVCIGCRVSCEEDVLTIDDIFDKIEFYREKYDVFIQVFEADMIMGKVHLIWAYEKALRSFQQETNRAISLEMETLLWSSGEKQIKDALKKMGIKEETEHVAIISDSDPTGFVRYMGWEIEDDALEPTMEKLRNYGITEDEIGSTDKPYDLLFEKMSIAIL